jgi:AraC-like DNA-binding protein
MKVQFRKDGLDKKWQVDSIKRNDENISGKVEFRDSKFIWPESVASGSSSLHRLDNHIELVTCNLIFNTRTTIERIPTDETKFYAMHINCTSLDLIQSSDKKESKLGGPFHSIAYWAGSNIDSCYTIQPGEGLLGIIIFMSKEFVQSVFANNSLSSNYTDEQSFEAASPCLYDTAENRAYKTLTEQKETVSLPMPSSIGKLQYDLVQEILHLNQNPSISETLCLKANIIKILGLYIKRIINSNERSEEFVCYSDTSKIFEVKKIIDENAGSEQISLDELAKTAAMSKTKLKTKFKEIVGTSAYQYYLDVKMEKAKSILEASSIPISGLAYELGFKSTSHFSQAFKKHYGVTPKSVAMKNYPTSNFISAEAV